MCHAFKKCYHPPFAVSSGTAHSHDCQPRGTSPDSSQAARGDGGAEDFIFFKYPGQVRAGSKMRSMTTGKQQDSLRHVGPALCSMLLWPGWRVKCPGRVLLTSDGQVGRKGADLRAAWRFSLLLAPPALPHCPCHPFWQCHLETARRSLEA